MLVTKNEGHLGPLKDPNPRPYRCRLALPSDDDAWWWYCSFSDDDDDDVVMLMMMIIVMMRMPGCIALLSGDKEGRECRESRT